MMTIKNNRIYYFINGCKIKKKPLKRLDMLKKMTNLKSTLYEDKEL